MFSVRHIAQVWNCATRYCLWCDGNAEMPHTKREITDIKESIRNRLKSEHVKYGNNNRIQFSSVQDGICVLGKAYMCSTPYLRSFPNVAFEMVPVFVWLTMALSRPFKETGSQHIKGSKEHYLLGQNMFCVFGLCPNKQLLFFFFFITLNVFGSCFRMLAVIPVSDFLIYFSDNNKVTSNIDFH